MAGESILVILLVGLVAGWLAGHFVRGTGFGLIPDVCIGIVGALIGNWLLSQLGMIDTTTEALAVWSKDRLASSVTISATIFSSASVSTGEASSIPLCSGRQRNGKASATKRQHEVDHRYLTVSVAPYMHTANEPDEPQRF